MAFEIELLGYCDARSCGKRIKAGESFYCQECYEALIKAIDDLTTEIERIQLERRD